MTDYTVDFVDASHGELPGGLSRESAAAAALTLYNMAQNGSHSSSFARKAPGDSLIRVLATSQLMQPLTRITARENVQSLSIKHQNVIFYPGSSTHLLDAAMQALLAAGVSKKYFIAPEGHYKSLQRHAAAENTGVRGIPLNAALHVDVQTLDNMVSRDRAPIAGYIETRPGNPFIVPDNLAHQLRVAGILKKHGVPYIHDALFAAFDPGFTPMANLVVEGESMAARGITIIGNSKTQGVDAPFRCSAAYVPQQQWFDSMVTTIPETYTDAANIFSYMALLDLSPGRAMRMVDLAAVQSEKFLKALTVCNTAMAPFALETIGVQGKSPYIALKPNTYLENGLKALYPGVWQQTLQKALHDMVGVQSLALTTTGYTVDGVRLNIIAPEYQEKRQPENLDILISRMQEFAQQIMSPR